MSTESANPFENPLYRYAIGFSGALVILAMAVFYVEGWMRYALVSLAVVDAAVVPHLLARIVSEE